jgi:pimeloyl-ACP methyl ester carboxylesterase
MDSSHRGRARALAGSLALTLLLATCSSGSTSSEGADEGGGAAADAAEATTTTTALAPFDGDDFYATPEPLPEGDHGTLVRFAEADEVEVPGGTAYRIMYLSESLEGDPIVVTGIASVPTAEAPDGGRPQITVSHGTTGIADECAPSKDPARTEFSLVSGTLGDEFLVAATDYEGLGTPGRHPYLVGESEGRSSIDALLAARQLPGAEGGDRFAIAGYSQGGHGALWTSQVAAEWAPDIEVVGTFAGAPASEIDVILAAAPYLPQAGFAYMVVAGFGAAYPEATAESYLTPEGVELLDAVDEGCAQDTFAAVAGKSPRDLIREDAPGSELWTTLAEENNGGTEKTNDAPTIVIHSEQDGTVPPAFSEMLLERMCGLGQVVERRMLPTGGHGDAAIPAYDLALDWIEARFADEPPADGPTAVTDSCPG